MCWLKSCICMHLRLLYVSAHALHGLVMQAQSEREAVHSPVTKLQQQPGLQHLWAI